MQQVVNFLRNLNVPASEIAGRSNLSEERVRAIMDGAPASVADLRALSEGLKIPIRAIVAPPAKDLALLFRSTTKSSSSEGYGTEEKVAEYVEAALRILPKPGPDIARAFREIGPKQENFEEAEALALKFRQTFLPQKLWDDPLTELPRILDHLGVIIGRLRRSKYEGASLVSNGFQFVFVSPRFSGRMLFTVAHELGHLLAHHQRQDAKPIFDLISDIGGNKREKRAEAFVDAFASALLLPKRGIGQTLHFIRAHHKIPSGSPIGDIELLFLARYFGVSFETAAYRCERLKLLPFGTTKALSDHLKKEHGSAEKRADSLNLPPRASIELPILPNVLRRPAIESINAGEVSAGWLSEKLDISLQNLYGINSNIGGADGIRH